MLVLLTTGFDLKTKSKCLCFDICKSLMGSSVVRELESFGENILTVY